MNNDIRTLLYNDNESFSYGPLYKDNRYWVISYEGDSKLVIRSGYIDGSENVYYHEVTTNNSGRSLIEQAKLEAKSRYEKKIHSGYVEKDEVRILPTPMLANKFDKYRNIKFPVYVQVKIDGVRSLIYRKGDKIIMKSRQLHDQVLNDKYFYNIRYCLRNIPELVILDGELYNPTLTFEQLISAVRVLGDNHDKLRYYMFDIIVLDKPNMTFKDRYKILLDIYSSIDNRYIYLLHNNVADNIDDIESYYNQSLQLGYEGVMIRDPEGVYINRRCRYLLKYKPFIDEEGTVIGVEDCRGNEKGLAKLIIKDDNGNIFTVRPEGSFENRRLWLNNPSLIIGKRYTYRYFERTNNGIPRFPVGIGIRDYE